jgi:hypothetical protein
MKSLWWRSGEEAVPSAEEEAAEDEAAEAMRGRPIFLSLRGTIDSEELMCREGTILMMRASVQRSNRPRPVLSVASLTHD